VNKDRLNLLMRDAGLDAVIAVSPENTYYLSGTRIDTQVSIRDRLAIVLWPCGEEPSFIVCNLEEAQARAESSIKDIRSYFEFKTSPVALLADLIKERGLSGKKLGLEMRYLSAHYFVELESLMAGARFVDCSELLEKVRMIKTPDEIELMKKSFLLTDQVIRKTFLNIKIGKTERETGTEMQVNLLQAGADAQAFLTLPFGEHGVQTHPSAGEREARPGDIIRTDFGGVFKGYVTDLARTCAVKSPGQRQLDIYRWLWDVHERCIQKMQPGTPVPIVYGFMKDLYEKAGMGWARPHVGHSLGLVVHEYPMIMPYADEELAPNMIVCIEPNHLVPGVEKYHVEDAILITDRGPEIISRSADWSQLLIVGLVLLEVFVW
jgi:Xaa-Pro aminopeptidase